MKITKFPQSCIMVESKGKRILIDPGKTKYSEEFIDFWETADAILITHRHGDHFNIEALKQLKAPIYSTKEVQSFTPELKINVIKENDAFEIGNLKVEVVKAIHGYIMPAGEINENVGFILDDGKTRMYVTSDTIRFKNDYKADVLFADVTAFDASMNLWGASATYSDVGAKLLIIAHQDDGKMLYDQKQIEDYLKAQGVNFIIPAIMQTLEI